LDIERDGRTVAPQRFPGRQGRRAFAYLVLGHGRPIHRDELAEAVWGGAHPPAWEVALSALVSKLRVLLREFGLADPAALQTAFGCYQLRVPGDAWIDVEIATRSLDLAEGALRSAEVPTAWSHAAVASAIARRPFLPGEEGDWIERQRDRLRGLLVRALECLADCGLARDQYAMAIQVSSDAVSLEPYRETAYRRLMAAHAGAGNRAEALRVYERCRRLLRDDLGADPSPPTEALFLDLLGPTPPSSCGALGRPPRASGS
jgi:DNA-binding SARP family transcriptional activator